MSLAVNKKNLFVIWRQTNKSYASFNFKKQAVSLQLDNFYRFELFYTPFFFFIRLFFTCRDTSMDSYYQ